MTTTVYKSEARTVGALLDALGFVSPDSRIQIEHRPHDWATIIVAIAPTGERCEVLLK
jgi:hypothetical protein